MIKYVKPFTATLTDDQNKRICTLLWGDPVHIIDSSVDPCRVVARTKPGRLPASALRARSLLELYIIDAGQGDSLLLKTPAGKWHLIDAGNSNARQMLGKGAPNFIRWKFQNDLQQPGISLESVILTHPDFDHFGGFLDVLAGDLHDGRTFPIEVKNYYHPGLARFASEPTLGTTEPGRVAAFPIGRRRLSRDDEFITELLDGKASFAQPPRPFDADFAALAELVARVPAKVRRISSRDEYLPGYRPGQNAVTIRILGPVLEEFAPARFGLRACSSDSKLCNGHSVVLRIEYGDARFLLTGDQNAWSQRLLLSYFPAGEFAADVAKACHHGAEDIELDFIKAMGARATVISSGDNEDYAHPRPALIGASARHGRESVDENGQPLPPLVYSTELARSTKLDRVASVSVALAPEPVEVAAANARIRAATPSAKYQEAARTPIASDLIYGLINVRTDGHHILCATMAEKGNDFDVKVFKAGVSP